MRVDFSNCRIIKQIKRNAMTPLDENMFVLPTTSVDSFIKSNDMICAKLRFVVSKIVEFFSGKNAVTKNKSMTKEAVNQQGAENLIQVEAKISNSDSNERMILTKNIKELVNYQPQLPNAALRNTNAKKLLDERKKLVKAYEITHYADIRLKKDLYKRQLEYLGLEVTEIPKEIQLNYDLAYWQDRYKKTGSDETRKVILKIEEDMLKLGISKRELSEVETLKAKYLEEMGFYNVGEQKIARIKEIDAKLEELKKTFEK